MTLDNSYDTALALVGMSGRFPGARNVETFWRNIAGGVSSLRRFSDEELLAAGVDPSLLKQPGYVKAGAVLDEIERFDANFFGFTPREAEVMDPQHRLFLECAWEALEDAAYDPRTYKGFVGTFAGSAFSTYLLNNLFPRRELMELLGQIQIDAGNERDSLASMVAYKLNLKGPAISVQTFCSTSLVAVHLACQSLLSYESDMALAGGVAILVPQGSGYFYEEGSILSPDGTCRTFDVAAQGSVMGNGVGVVALKRLQDAREAGDHIYAVIRASAVNNDGSVRVSYTAPGLDGQSEVIAGALSYANVPAESIGYIETHGTATKLGDAVELAAMLKAYAPRTQRKQFCAIGSAKPNVGHLDRASGVTGLIKTALALQHQQLPPSLNFTRTSDDIDLANSPFYVNTILRAWETHGSPRRAGVSSFGLGGTNAHVILEEAPEAEPTSAARPWQLLLLSARTAPALQQMRANLAEHLRQHPELDLADVASTLQRGRSAFNQRLACVVHKREDAIALLESDDGRRVWQLEQTHRERPVAFLLPGVGEQYPGMAQELYAQEPVFRAAIERCCQWLKVQQHLDLYELLCTGNARTASESGQALDLRALVGRNGSTPDAGALKQTALAQPAVFVMEYALAQTMLQWGIKPQALLGYSLGEYVAACLAGVLSLEDALMLVAERARLINALAPGAMLAVSLSEQEIQPYLDQQLELAAVNSPTTCVLAGPLEAIAAVEQRLSAQEITHRRVETTHAFHTHMLAPAQEALTRLVRTMTLHEPQIPYLSNLTGTWVTAEQATNPAYWAEHMCQTVRFADGAALLLQEEEWALLELGPGQALGSFIKQHPLCKGTRAPYVLATLPTAYEHQSVPAYLLQTSGRLWLAGVKIDWDGFYQTERRQRLSLPTYPFQRERYWLDAPAHAQRQIVSASPGNGKRPESADWFYTSHWQPVALSAQEQPTERGPWLIFVDTSGIGESLAERLEQRGQIAIKVSAATTFAALDERHYTLRPGQRDDYLALGQELAHAGLLPRTIIHAWNLATRETSLSFADWQERGFYSLLYLTQALLPHLQGAACQLLVLANQLQSVTGHESLIPAKATLLGACTVIPQENMNLTCRSIDLDWPDSDAQDLPALLEALLTEPLQPAHELAIAYRDTVRLVQAYQPQRLAAPAGAKTALRQRGVYLLTGGLGGIGLTLAEYLAETFKARLALTSRSPLPQRRDWSAWLASHAETDPVASRIRRIQALEALGADVLLLQADVADPLAMREALAQIDAHFGALHGVIHLAGVTADATFKAVQELTAQDCELHFQAKVHGLANLDSLLAGRELDFCLLFSSLSAVLGGLGFAAYSAANCFMDAFALQQRSSTLPWLSVNWDTWQVGTPKGDSPTLGSTVAAFEMSAAEGTEAFAQIMAQPETGRLVHSTGDLQARIRQWVLLEGLRAETNDESDAPGDAARPASGDFERLLKEIWQQVLGVEQVGLYDNFFDLGGNSLNGLQVVSRIRKVFHMQVPVVALFEAPTISAMAKYLQPQVEPGPMANDGLNERRRQARQGIGKQEIAIVGMSGRFPGAENVEVFWENLRNGVESISFFSAEELREAGVSEAELRDPNYVRARPILTGVENFDAAFFGYTPRDAELLDPQHRLFLECSWEALEQAGYAPDTYAGLVGVFGGANVSSYLHSLLMRPEVVSALAGRINGYQVAVATDKDAVTTGVSYKLNLRGPSYSVQTFCSTSLVAVHLACQSLRLGECDLALAGGVSVQIPVKRGYIYQEGGMESPDGHCRTFDAQAGGSMFGDGAGVVVLKRLSEALEDGDTIYAVIKGSAMNNDGSLKVSYTAPSVVGQTEVVEAALEAAGVSSRSIDYVEAHGTATELGDPIEVESLTRAYRKQTDEIGYCRIGSVKTNVGHLDRAAGISGLIKTVQALVHEEIPPSLHYEQPNPQIDFASSPFTVNARLTAWKRNGHARRAGINSLGMGGTNVHLIVEEAPAGEASSAGRSWEILLWSGKTASAAERVKERLAAYLRAHEQVPLADIAYTLQVGRSRMEQRQMLVCRDRADALATLEGQGAGRIFRREERQRERAVAFVLPGVGEQSAGMVRDLYAQEEVFRAAVDNCARILQNHLGRDIRQVLLPASGSEESYAGKSQGPDLRALLGRSSGPQVATQPEIKQTELAQPAVFVIEYALAQLLQQWGVRPQAMLGYSLGEYVAACLAGVLSLEDALKLVAQRARLIATVEQGAMLAVMLSEEDVQPYLDERVNLAVINSPAISVLAGPLEAIEDLQRLLGMREIASRRVETTHAFHSRMLESVQEQLSSLVGEIRLHPPRIPYISNLTGTWITAQEATDPAYWARHMCQTVRFADGAALLLEHEDWLLLEVGPGQGLSSFIKQHPLCSSTRLTTVLSTLPQAHERQADQAYLLGVLGKLWLAGVQLDWQGFHAGTRRQRVPLPTYPFERQRYWIDVPQNPAGTSATLTASNLAEELPRIPDLADWFFLPTWKQGVPRDPFAETAPDQAGSWLIFQDQCGLGEELAHRLRAAGSIALIVKPGPLFVQDDEWSYRLRPEQRADYEALLKDLRVRGILPAHIAHLWMVTPAGTTGDDLLKHGFYSLLALAQALGEADVEACEIALVANELYDVSGDEALCPEKATAIGPCRVIPQEYASLRCRSIDPGQPGPDQLYARPALDCLLEEILCESHDSTVALRRGRRWLQTFEPVRLKARPTSLTRLRTKGVYLITGGLGGIGLAMASHLIRSAQANVVLTGRTALPPRAQWAQFLATHDETHSTSQKLKALLELEAQGGKVLALTADVTDEAQMERVVHETIATFGALHGVLHAAGLPGVGLMQLKAPEDATRVLAPKVQGTRVLQRVLKDQALDFMVLFSSMTSLTGGGPGQVDYCAANAFLDAYARKYNSEHGQTIAIAWGEWQWNAWEGALTGYDPLAQAFFKENRQRFGISFEDGAEVLTRLLTSRFAQIVVSTQDFRAVVERSKEFTAATVLERTRQQRPAGERYARPALATSYVAPRNQREQQIVAVWEDLLGIEPVGMNDNFFELGGNSLTGLDLITRLRKVLQIENLPSHVLYEAPSVGALAAYITQSHEDRAVEGRHERGEKRREGLKQRMRENRRAR